MQVTVRLLNSRNLRTSSHFPDRQYAIANGAETVTRRIY